MLLERALSASFPDVSNRFPHESLVCALRVGAKRRDTYRVEPPIFTKFVLSLCRVFLAFHRGSPARNTNLQGQGN